MPELPKIRTSGNDIFDAVRQGFETVARMASHVKIHEELIAGYAAALPDKSPANVLDETHHYSGDDESTAAYILMLDSINFGSGYQPHMVTEGWKLINDSIYFSISTRLKSYFETQGPVSAPQLAAFTPEACAKLLELNSNGTYSVEFARLCAFSLRELGAVVTQEHDGKFMNMVNAANGNAAAMVGMLARMHHFNDVHMYRGHSIPFYKRAQITAADLHLAFRQRGEKLFPDIGRLTMFADNGIPHVFHVDGLLEYTPALTRRIKEGENIPSGSEEEVEIRACAGYLVERLAAAQGMIAMDIDHILWHRSVESRKYRESQPHRTLSRFY